MQCRAIVICHMECRQRRQHVEIVSGFSMLSNALYNAAASVVGVVVKYDDVHTYMLLLVLNFDLYCNVIDTYQ